MRDAHRLKEKRDLSALLGGRTFGIGLVALVLLGGVFLFGLMAGRRMSDSQGSSDNKDLLAALDEKAENPSYTFHDELTKKSVEAIPPPPTPAPALPPEAPAEPPKVDPPSPPAAAAEPPPPPPAAKAEPEAKPNPPAAEKQGAAKAEPQSKPKQEVKVAAAAKPAAESDGAKGTFTLQVSSAQNRNEAEKLAQSLKQRGYAPYIVEAQLTGKGTWYRVRLGRFPSKEAAARYLQDFRRETQMSAFVTSSNH
jgi:cell division septation protein DedD